MDASPVPPPTRVIGSAPARGHSLWRSMGRLFAARQQLVCYLIAIAACETLFLVGVVWALRGLGSFSAVARAVFEEADTLSAALSRAGSGSVWLVPALVLFLLGGALVNGWLRGGFLLALGGGPATLRPPLATVRRLAAYDLLFALIVLGLGQVDPSGISSLPFLVVGLYADYAIALDRVGLARGLVLSARLVRRAPGISLLVFVAALVIGQIAYGAFHSGFVDASYVQPTYLVAFLLLRSVIQLATDVALITVYRASRISEAGSAAPR